MKAIFKNDVLNAVRQKFTYALVIAYVLIGFLTGFKFNISAGENLAPNAPYSVGFMVGMLSLIIILIATIFAFSMLFREQDSDFNLVIFTTPISKRDFALGRFGSFFSLTVFSFLLLVIGYTLGLYVQSEKALSPGFNAWHFIYPFLIFGVINSFLICSTLFFVASKSKNKLLVAITGILLYVVYMIGLMFSNAPFMAQSMPQSLFVQKISGLVDLFGLSGYFFEGSGLSLFQRNNAIVPFSNYLLLNRLIYVGVSIFLVYQGMRSFSFLKVYKRRKQVALKNNNKIQSNPLLFTTAGTEFNVPSKWRAILSFIKIDSIYIFKSVPIIAITMLLIFFIGVEMYNDIDKGIRLPQHYASSGLLSQTINSSFFGICSSVLVYFVNDVFWRSKSSDFSIIESTTFYEGSKMIGHIGSMIVLILFLSAVLILEAIVFQLVFNFTSIDVKAYFGVVVFNTMPLMLLALLLIFINYVSRSKLIALGLSVLGFLLLATPISKSIIKNSLFRFFSGYRGAYSDFIGYGSYIDVFALRLVFGLAILIGLFLIYSALKFNSGRVKKALAILPFAVIAYISGTFYLNGYHQLDRELSIEDQVLYEKKYRAYQTISQPTITDVSAAIDLYPEQQAYTIKGSYVVKNKSKQNIDSILVNLPDGFALQKLQFIHNSARTELTKSVSVIQLDKPLVSMDSATLDFEISYQWKAVNGHNPFNAIVEDGSFMRISRYFPQIGYDDSKEITDEVAREAYGLGEATQISGLDDPKVKRNDFIDLDLKVSTTHDQTVVSVGELMHSWKENNRNYYHYVSKSIPFRFAISSAEYQKATTNYNGIDIEVLYHPLHGSNVEKLIANAKLSLDYCISNFGAYPFNYVRFAEVSAFTSGFAGTSYPGVIFMTEDKAFNANISTDDGQDVINELAGHEVSHFWWGNTQISPDYREGHVLLTEGLAMYTEMMIYKKMHGKEKMNAHLDIHKKIFESEKGFYDSESLIKAKSSETHLSYSKSAMVFAELSELVGEQNLNHILKAFLKQCVHSDLRPTSRDLMAAILEHTDEMHHDRIQTMFL